MKMTHIPQTDKKWTKSKDGSHSRTINDKRYTIYYSRPGEVRYITSWIDFEINKRICVTSPGNYKNFESAKRAIRHIEQKNVHLV